MKFLAIVAILIAILTPSAKAICDQIYMSNVAYTNFENKVSKCFLTKAAARAEIQLNATLLTGFFSPSQLVSLFNSIQTNSLSDTFQNFNLIYLNIPLMSTSEYVNVVRAAGNPYNRYLFVKYTIQRVTDLNKDNRWAIYEATELNFESAVYALFKGWQAPTCGEPSEPDDDCEQDFKTDAQFQAILNGIICFSQADLPFQMRSLLVRYDGVFKPNQLQTFFTSIIGQNLEAILGGDFRVLAGQIPLMTTQEFIPVMKSAGNPYSRYMFLKFTVNYIEDLNRENKKLINDATELDYEGAVYAIFDQYSPLSCLFGDISGDSVAFIIDTSFSMDSSFEQNGKTQTRMEYVKKSLKDTIKNLPDTKKFNIISFSTGVKPWQTNNVVATQQNKNAAISYIESFYPNGNTNIGAALEQAYSQTDIDSMVLLTDGAPTVGIRTVGQFESLIDVEDSDYSIPIDTISFMKGGSETTDDRIKAQEILKAISAKSNGNFKKVE